MRISVLVFGFLFALAVSCGERAEGKKKILIVYAHPDDETAIGPVIAKLAKQHRIILMTLTDGRTGYRDHAKIPKGDSLGAVRKMELECSCQKLGIDSLVMVGLHEGLGLFEQGNIQGYFREMRQARELLPKLIQKINPDLIITFGPDGDSGHIDHRLVSDLVTEAILHEGWVDKYPLYYSSWTHEQGKMYGGLGSVYDDYLNVEVKFTDQEEQQYFEALRCHWSQYTEEELTEMKNEDMSDKSNTIFLRRFTVARDKTTQFP